MRGVSPARLDRCAARPGPSRTGSRGIKSRRLSPCVSGGAKYLESSNPQLLRHNAARGLDSCSELGSGRNSRRLRGITPSRCHVNGCAWQGQHWHRQVKLSVRPMQNNMPPNFCAVVSARHLTGSPRLNKEKNATPKGDVCIEPTGSSLSSTSLRNRMTPTTGQSAASGRTTVRDTDC